MAGRKQTQNPVAKFKSGVPPMTRSFFTLKNMSILGTFAMFVSAAGFASAQNKSEVNVPFAFTANHHPLPAARYEVLSSESSLTMINVNSKKVEAILLIRRESGDAIETRGCMEFSVSGSHHVLSQVQFAGSSMHSVLLGQPRREPAVARNVAPTIQLAMK
jgi:hypothetical protein